jgi:hypothetical protein
MPALTRLTELPFTDKDSKIDSDNVNDQFKNQINQSLA